MKKVFILLSLISVSFLLIYCNPSKRAAKTVVKTSYGADVSALIAGKCSPCHIPANGGKKKPYDNYANVKADIDDIISRIEKSPGEKGFMPMRSTTKLSDSVITVFRKWKEDGLGE